MVFSSIHFHASDMISVFFMTKIPCVHTPHFIYMFVWGQASVNFPQLGYGDLCCYKYGYTCVTTVCST